MKNRHQSSHIYTKDGLRLFTQYWAPIGEKQGNVLITHGYAEHSSRYSHVADYFNKKGFGVYSYDLRGHGKSEGERTYFRQFEDYVLDLEKVYGEVKEKEGKFPLFLLGHSMGGAITVLFSILNSPSVNGVMLSAPFLQLGQKVSPVLLYATKFLNLVAPKLPIVPMDSSGISRNLDVVKRYNEDPLVYHGKVLVHTGYEFQRIFEWMPSQYSKFDLPLLLLHGTGDRLAHPAGSDTFYENISSKDKHRITYDGWYHELLNEDGQLEVMNSMFDWMGSYK